jgi:hypothetical protein
VDFNNTAQPYHGTKDAYVSSYSKGSTLTFTTTTQPVDNSKTLRAFIRLNNSNYSFQFQFFNGTTAVSNIITASVNNSLFGSYQNVSIPLSSFTWSGTTFTKLVISMTGKGTPGTYYLDYVSLEGGTPVITPVDYSNKVDSVSRIAGSYYYWAKGVKHLISVATDSSAYHTLTINPDTSQVTLNRPDGTSSIIPLPFVKKSDTSTTVISHEGAGIWTIYGSSSDTLHAKNLQAGTGVTLTKNADSSITISSTSGNTNSNIGSGYRLAVPFTNNIKTIFAVSPLGIDSATNSNALTFTFDTTLYHSTAYNNTVYGSLSQQNTNTSSIASNTTAIAGKQNSLTLTTTGTSGAATLTGATLNIPQYSGGGITADSTITATAGQTSFTFSSVPALTNDYIIFINGNATTNFTASGNTITLGMTDLLAGDKVRYKRIK